MRGAFDTLANRNQADQVRIGHRTVADLDAATVQRNLYGCGMRFAAPGRLRADEARGPAPRLYLHRRNGSKGKGDR